VDSIQNILKLVVKSVESNWFGDHI